MTETATVTRDELTAAMVAAGHDEGIVATVVGSLPDDAIAATYEALQARATERAEIRARLCADAALRTAVCPAADWKDADSRYEVARRAILLVEAAAATASKQFGQTVSATQIAEALIAGEGTVADTIATHGDDPRVVMWGESFYAFRWRLRDAIEVVNSDAAREATRIREAARDAEWARQGLVRCDRCGGVGGASHWPGFTCFDCDGRGCVAPKDARSR